VFDAHLHIVDPRFPLLPNQGYLPDPFTVADYHRATAGLDVRGGAVVSGSFQGFDQSYLLDALTKLGPAFVGVAQLPADATAERILELHAAGVRAVRFNLVRGGSAGPDDVDALGRLAHDTAGWSSEFYVRSDDLASVGPAIARLPRASIDHLGLTADGLEDLLRLVAKGVRVKPGCTVVDGVIGGS
jgi:predicted TIM-barrel fold metal-dependent hydrolase